ncbi:citrate synthase [Candidatus Woesearchaeota archaeon]|nr:citrate synthase [Candidatus Woesearchaeota archaeon]
MTHIFEKDHLDKVDHGLADTKAIVTIKSKVDGSGKGALYYEGYSIEELADKSTFEEICFLLHNDRLPKDKELVDFSAGLANKRALTKETAGILKQVSKDEPMAMLRTAVSTLSASAQGDDEQKAMDLISKFASIVAAIYRTRQGLDIVDPDSSLSTAADFLHMLKGEQPEENDAMLLDALMIIMADHGMNASTFTARLVTSTDSDIYSAITAAVSALKGPLHGGANEEAIKMIDVLDRKFKDSDDLKNDVEDWVKEQLSQKKKIMGIGHRVYKGGDPRARILRKRINELLGDDDRMFIIADTIDMFMQKEKGLSANCDLYSGILYARLGIPEELFTLMFAMSRIAGWTAHVLEQKANNKLIRPKGVYVEEVRPLGQKYVPISNR